MSLSITTRDNGNDSRALHAEKYFDKNNPDIYTMDIQPYSYQQEILDKLELNVQSAVLPAI